MGVKFEKGARFQPLKLENLKDVLKDIDRSLSEDHVFRIPIWGVLVDPFKKTYLRNVSKGTDMRML